MEQALRTDQVDNVLTLEEISNLAAEGGQSAETLMNVVALVAYFDRTDREHTHSSSAGWIGRNSTCIFSLQAKIFSPASTTSATLVPRVPQMDET